jgi:LysM repeat protein
MGLDKRWTDTVDDGLTNSAWDAWDDAVKTEFDGYNLRFKTVAGYKQVDRKWGKAIVWVESGGPSSDMWNTRPMQIGNKSDKAYAVLKTGGEGSSVIMSPTLASEIKTGDINDPKLNIRAGLACLFTRMAKFDSASVEDQKDKTEYTYTVLAGDNLSVIAKRVGTTVDNLQKMNPGVRTLQPKQVLKYKKASVQLVISGWRTWDSATIAERYNVGDEYYAAKLEYVLDLFTKLKR